MGLVIVLVAACGSVLGSGPVDATASNDGDARPPLVMSQTADRVDISVPGRFRLVFDRAWSWQPIGWYDLASAPDQNLTEETASLPAHRVLGALNIETDDGWSTASAATDATLDASQLSDHVELDAELRWTTAHHRLVAHSLQTVDADGVWTTRVDVSDEQAAPGIAAVELANVHLTPAVSWSAEDGIASFSFVTDGAAPSLEVTRTSRDGVLQADEGPTARYFVIAQPLLPVEVTWQMRLWTKP